jgi:HD-GYP domain-containing protein (c-di-GMP phosphodiesterase class II)
MSTQNSPITESKIDVLITSQQSKFWQDVQGLLKGYSQYKLHFVGNTDDILTPKEVINPLLAIIDGQGGTLNASEWVQSVKMTYPECQVLVLYSSEQLVDFTLVKKNGANYIMHAGYDREFISDMFLKLAPVELKGIDIPTSALLPIDLNDVNTEEPISFDLYIHLPANEKSFRVRKDGGKIDDRLFEKSSETHQRLYIKKTQMKAFFDYARAALARRGIGDSVPITEKVYNSKQLIYEIITEFLNGDAADFQAGKLIFERCRQVLAELDLLKEKTPEARVSEIYRFTGHTRSTYQDAINMAVFASNFAGLLGLNAAKIENAALAGLLHNVGMAKLPSSTIGKSLQDFTPEEKAEYKAYPDRSVILIKSKKVPLPQEAADGIVEHQENVNGSGFPHGLPADKIHALGKIMRLASRFLELTSLNGEIQGMNPKAALKLIKEESMGSNACVDLTTASQIFKIMNS